LSARIVRTVADLRAQVGAWREEGLTSAYVPTMGSLHEGHLSLVRLGLEKADRAALSIFVNPTQFAPHEDFDAYPRAEAADVRAAASAGAELIFAPNAAEMYAEGFATSFEMKGPAEGLETDFRPHFFGGVALVVAKLLIQAGTDYAIFGEKDYQQLCVVKRLVKDLDIPTEIIGGPIVRDEAGLALSSRNAYLSPEELAVARTLNKTLFASAADIAAEPARAEVRLGEGRAEILRNGFTSLDYLELRQAGTLAPFTPGMKEGRLLVAATIGRTRLIDNVAVEVG
jgi:pantoate--beta-alanine ligase